MTTKKLFWYYLKKLLWRSWRPWIIILFSWIWWGVIFFGFSWIVEKQFSTRDSKMGLLNTHSLFYYGSELGSEECVKLVKENIDKFDCPAELKEKIKKNLQKFEDEYKDLSYEEREKKVREKIENVLEESRKFEKSAFLEWLVEGMDVTKESDAERWKRRYSYWGFIQNLGLPIRTPYDFNLVEFASPLGQKERSAYQRWGLINNISIWNFAGFMVGGFFVYTLIDKLFFNTKKDGEDMMVVSFTPGVQRSQIFFGKVLAYITTLAVFVLLGCVLPYGVLIGMSTGLAFFPWLNFLWLALYSTIIGSLCFTLIAGGFYLFFNTLGGVGRVLQWLMSYLPLIMAGAIFAGKYVNTALAYIQYYYYHPVVHLGLAAGLGFLLFSLYLSYYKQEDLS